MVDLSPGAVTERLREWARLSASAPPRPSVDMSPSAVTRRLRELSRLHALCRELMRVGAAHRAK